MFQTYLSLLSMLQKSINLYMMSGYTVIEWIVRLCEIMYKTCVALLCVNSKSAVKENVNLNNDLLPKEIIKNRSAHCVFICHYVYFLKSSNIRPIAKGNC